MERLEGYVADIDFTAVFWSVMAPTHIRFVAAMNGVTAPDPEKAYRYVELGCGQGFVTNILAAANPHAEFVGIDLNPAHIINAREMARDAQLSNVTFREESFRETAEMDDTSFPPVDYIVLHSIISWIPYENLEAIRKLIESKLKSGGIVYISYNSMPGWAELQPIRQLFYEYAKRTTGGSGQRVSAAADWASRLLQSNLAYFEINPSARQRIEEMLSKSEAYLAHEYLSEIWRPNYVTEVVEELGRAKLNFVAPANAVESFGDMYVAEDTMARVREAPDRPLAEMIKDYACNQWFRRDLFVRGMRDLTAARQREQLEKLSFAPLVSDPEADFHVATILGEPSVPTDACRAAARTMADGPKGFDEVRDVLGVDDETCLRALAALVSAGWIHPMVGDVDPAPARRLNRVIAQRILRGESYRNVAGPTVGTGIAVDDVDGVALDLIAREGELSAEALGERLHAAFAGIGRQIVKFGGLVEMQSPSRTEMADRANEIVEKKLPLWRALNLLPTNP